MSIPRIGNTSAVLSRYQQRQFRIFVVADTEAGAKQLAEQSQAPDTAHVVSIEELHRRLDAGNRSGVPLFDRPTVLVRPDKAAEAYSAAWASIDNAAHRSPSPVVNVEMDPPSLETRFQPRRPKP